MIWIDGVETKEGDRVLFHYRPTRWQVFTAWLKERAGIAPHGELQKWNTVWRVENGSWQSFPGQKRVDSTRWLRPTRLNRIFVWVMAAMGIHGFGIVYDYSGESDDYDDE